ncbi:MAG: acyl CoA:acetate/3-ketoacid CoA transferase subunit beta, partial [Deltaproteobacteria bacterium]|nr:acyl CoA:acetate/3-ketoacid CoA transferase subunit beta [Deltaproteobacteria bacterium]
MSLPSRDKIARRAEQEIIAGQVVNLGIGIPTLILKYLNWEKRVQLHSENGILGMQSHCSRETADRNLIDAGGGYIDLVKGASFFDSSLSFALVRGGRLDIAFLGALE